MGPGALPLHYYAKVLVMCPRILKLGRGGASVDRASRNFDDEIRAASLLCFDANACVMRLQNLIDDGQAEPGAANKSGLEGFENACGLRWVNADAGVANLDAHPVVVCRDADGEHAACGHG